MLWVYQPNRTYLHVAGDLKRNEAGLRTIYGASTAMNASWQHSDSVLSWNAVMRPRRSTVTARYFGMRVICKGGTSVIFPLAALIKV